MTDFAVVTVADDAFVDGTIAFLYSFSRQNPDAMYDVVVIDAGLNDTNKNFLSLFPNLKLHPLSGALETKVAQLADRVPCFKGGKGKQFYALDLFNLTGYPKILFCDSDLLCLGSLQSVLALDQPFIACADFCNYQGQAHDAETFEIIDKTGKKPCLDASFNSGMMYIDQCLLTRENHQKALAMLSYAFWKKIKSPHTDQVIFNRLFKAFNSRIPIAYNYLLNRRSQLQRITGVLPAHARVLHFNGPKPWQFDRVRERMMEDPLMTPLFKKWLDIYTEAMQYLALKQRMANA